MKYIIAITLVLAAFAVNAQAVKVGSSGNYEIVAATKEPKTEAQLLKNATDTGKTIAYNGSTYKVYITANQKLFSIVTSKAGNLYRKYWKTTE